MQRPDPTAYDEAELREVAEQAKVELAILLGIVIAAAMDFSASA